MVSDKFDESSGTLYIYLIAQIPQSPYKVQRLQNKHITVCWRDVIEYLEFSFKMQYKYTDMVVFLYNKLIN